MEQSILDIKTHFKPTETFQYTSSHPPGVKRRIREGPSTETSIDSKERPLLKQHLKRKSQILKHAFQLEVAQKDLIERLQYQTNFTEREAALKQQL